MRRRLSGDARRFLVWALREAAPFIVPMRLMYELRRAKCIALHRRDVITTDAGACMFTHYVLTPRGRARALTLLEGSPERLRTLRPSRRARIAEAPTGFAADIFRHLATYDGTTEVREPETPEDARHAARRDALHVGRLALRAHAGARHVVENAHRIPRRGYFRAFVPGIALDRARHALVGPGSYNARLTLAWLEGVRMGLPVASQRAATGR